MNWTNIHQDFTPELQKQWEIRNFSHEETKKWIDISLQPTDYDYAYWLENVREVDAEWAKECNNNADLRRQYEKYLSEIYNEEESNSMEIDDEDKVMVNLSKSNAQQWLDQNYPKKQRWSIEKLDLSNQGLTGNLDLTDFFNLKEVNISGNPLKRYTWGLHARTTKRVRRRKVW